MGAAFDEEFLATMRPNVTRGASFSATTAAAKAGALAMQMAGLPLKREVPVTTSEKPMVSSAKES